MALGFFASSNDPMQPDAASYEDRERRRKLAEALISQGTDYSPVQSWTQGAARLAQALTGALSRDMAIREDRSANKAYSEQMARLIGGVQAPTAAPSPSTAMTTVDAGARPGGGPGSFDSSVARVFQFEGGLNPRDTNGTPSNMGINQAANPDVDVRNITQAQARDIYKTRYWDTIGADRLPPALAHVAFDTSVIAGPERAKQMLAASGGDPNKFMELREQFLSNLLQRNPQKFGPYADAWARRNQTLRQDIASGAQPTPMAYAAQPTASDAAAPAMRAVSGAVQSAPPPPGSPDAPLAQRPIMAGAAPIMASSEFSGASAPPSTAVAGSPSPDGVMSPTPMAGPRAALASAIQPALTPASGAVPAGPAPAPSVTAPSGQPSNQQAIAMAIMMDPRFSPQQKQMALQAMQMTQRDDGVTTVDLGDRIALMNRRGQVTGYLPKQRAPVAVGEGQRLVDPVTGREVVAPDGAKSPTVQRIKQPDGSEVAVQWDAQKREWVPLRAPEGGNPVATPKLTEQQSKDVGFYNRGERLLPRLEQQDKALTDFASSAGARIPIVGNFLKSDAYRQAEQTGRELLAVILRKDTGAAVTDSEMQLYSGMYLPQPGDDAATIKQKQEGRKTAIEGIRMGLGTAEILFKQREALDKAKSGQSGSSAPAQPSGGVDDGWQMIDGVRVRRVN